MLLISTFLQAAKKTQFGFFTREIWLLTNNTISSLITLLQSKKIDVKSQTKTDGDGGDIDSFLKNSDQQILPAIVNFIEKLDSQLFKAFQNLNQTSMEYLYRLKDECLLIKQCDNIIQYLGTHQDQEKIARVGLIKLEHIYSKHDSLFTKTKEALKGKPEKLAELYFLDKPSE